MLKKTTILVFLVILNLANPVLAKSSAKSTAEPPTFVDAVTVHPSTKQDQVSVTGSLVSIPGITVKSEIAGRITKIYFNSGDIVTAGTPLIEIYPDLIKAQLAQAQAQVQLTQLQFERSSKLYKTGDVARAVCRTQCRL